MLLEKLENMKQMRNADITSLAEKIVLYSKQVWNIKCRCCLFNQSSGVTSEFKKNKNNNQKNKKKTNPYVHHNIFCIKIVILKLKSSCTHPEMFATTETLKLNNYY